MNITERAAKVLQEIDSDLALTENATPGPWRNTANGQANVLCFPDQSNRNRPEFDGVLYMHTSNRCNDATFIAASRTGWPASLRCLETAIEGMLALHKLWHASSEWVGLKREGPRNVLDCANDIESALTTLCDQWEGKP